MNKYHLLHNVRYLQNRVNNVNDKKRMTLFTQFIVKQQNIFGLVLIDTRNLVHSIFVENHNSEPMVLKRGQTIGLLTSCIVMQEEQCQTTVERSNPTQSVTGTSNDTDTCIGGASVGDSEKVGKQTVYIL